MTEETEDAIFSKIVSAVKHKQAKKALELLKKIGPNSPYSKQCIPLKAECFFQRGWLPSTMQILKKFLVTEPNYLPALKTITLCLYRLKEYPDALVYANRFLEIDDSVEEIISIKNTCQKILEESDVEPELRITQHSTSTKRLSTLDWRTLLWEGINLEKNGDLEKALEKFETVYLLRPGNVSALEHIISILAELKMHEGLVQRIDERIEIGTKGTAILTKHFLTMKVKALMKLKRFYDALDSVILLIRVSPKFFTAIGMKAQIKKQLGYTPEVNAMIKTAEKDFKEKKWEEARKTYDRIILLLPSNLTSHAYKALCLSRLKKYGEAIECCKEAESITPHSRIAMAFVLRVKGEIYLKDGKPNEASDCLRDGIELDPYLPNNWYNWDLYGRALYKSEKWEEAAVCYEKCANLHPKNKSWYLWWRTKCLRNLGKLDEALSCISAAIVESRKQNLPLYHSTKGTLFQKKESHEDAAECYAKALEIRPNNQRDLYNLGYSLAHLGVIDKCLECYDKALEAKPDDWDTWSSKCHAMRVLGESQEMFKCAENMCRIAPNRFESNLEMAYVMNNQKISMANLSRPERLEKALQYVNDALSMSKEITTHLDMAFLTKAWILRGLKKYDEALQTLEDGLSLEPDNAQLLYTKGTIFYVKGEKEQALKCFDRAIELAPKEARSWKSKVRLLKMWGRLDDVIKTCSDALEYHPTNAFFWWQKGHTLSFKDNHPEAIACYDEALKLDPLDVFCMSKKGKSLTEMGNFDKAIECLKEANRIDPENDQVVSNLGYAYEKMKDYDTAKKYYGAAIDLMPEQFHFARMAWLCNLRKEYEEAVDNYKCCLEISEEPVTLALMADALYNWGHHDESLKICKDLDVQKISEQETSGYLSHSLTYSSVHRLTLTVMSKIYHDKKMFKESIDCCDRILRSDPTNIEILRIRMSSLSVMGDDKAAYSCAEEIRNLQEGWWLDDDTEMASEKTKDIKIKELERESGKKQARIDELEEEKGDASYRSIASLPIIEIINPANKHNESNFLEFKSSMRASIDESTGETDKVGVMKELSAKIAQTIAGFMNTDGGVLIIGYYDGDKPKFPIKRVIGLEKDYATLGSKRNWDAWLLAFNDLLTKNFEPRHLDRIVQPQPETYSGELDSVIGKGTMAKIIIKKSDVEVFHGDGYFAIRQGNRTINLNSEETVSYIAKRFKKM